MPQDLLKVEMDRLTRDIFVAESQLKAAEMSREEVERNLRDALYMSGNCAAYYAEATPAIRRLLNQGLFTKLYIDRDGEVERYDLTEPFARLLLTGGHGQVAQGTSEVMDDAEPYEDAPEQDSSSLGGDGFAMPMPRTPGQVLTSMFDEPGHETTHSNQLVAVGVNNELLAEAEGFEPPDGCPSPAFKAASGCPGLFGLVRGCRCCLVRGAVPSQPVPDRCYTRRYTSSWWLALWLSRPAGPRWGGFGMSGGR